MPALEVFDTVVLRANRQLVGIVDRTHYENNEPLQDILIIAHVPVSPAALTEFVKTGTPPKHHVFVRFSDEAQGNALVREDDVILLDRNFNLGDVVKRESDHMLGTVTSVEERYVLQPVWMHSEGIVNGTSTVTTVDTLMENPQHTCSSDCPFGLLSEIEHPLQSVLLHGIPGEELKKAEDVLEADYVIQDDWLGVAEELELMVIVLLEDESIVVVKDPDELYIPVSDSGKPLVSLPEFDNLRRPDPLVALQGWSATIPPHDFQCGQLVITNQPNLRFGRWLRGQYSALIRPQARILDVRTKSMDVRWLACNPLIPRSALNIDRPQPRTSLYENISTFPNRSELRLNKQVSIYDHSRLPRSTQSRTRIEGQASSDLPIVHSPTDFRVGDHVKFRDQAGAALKYQGLPSQSGVFHGRFDRIASSTTFGFDVNEFKIISSQQDVTVLWPDGTHSQQPSKGLNKFTLFEPELAPCDLVVAREQMKQRLSTLATDPSSHPLVDFNEMKFFEEPHDLLPKRVGVVQNVSQAERVAQIRWFADPKICIRSYGHVLNADSRFGKLSEVVEDVSLYEIMTFPALMRHLKDLVLIPPESMSAAAVDTIKSPPRQICEHGQTTLSHLNPYGSYDLLQWLQGTVHLTMHDKILPKLIDSTTYRTHLPVDWVGEIVGLGLDGIVTVRPNAREYCRDIRLEHDQIITFIDEAAIGGVDLPDAGYDDSDMDISMGYSEDIGSASTISETVEYEGGERLDDDSGDENWEDAEDADVAGDANEEGMALDEKPTSAPPTRINLPTSDMTTSGKVLQHEAVESSGERLQKPPRSISDSHGVDSLVLLMSNLSTLEPEPFAVLEREPPVDQYQERKAGYATSPAFLKRIAKEHRILASSLPKGEIFVRTYESRLDLVRCLIVGPADTPYEHAPFLVDLQLGTNFPQEPPTAHFHSWTSGLGRINPNLYEEGKICLSLLGTWPGKCANEGWSERATILQLLVSLQGLVFVRQPFYNEAGFEGYAEGKQYDLEAQRYNEKAYVMARGFVKHAVTAPVAGLEDVLAWIYLSHEGHPGLLRTIVCRSQDLVRQSECGVVKDELVDGKGAADDPTKVFLRLLSRGAIVMLKKTVQSLERLMTDLDDTDMIDAMA